MSRKLKMTQKQFKQYLLDRYVTNDGYKVSDRELWSDETFMNETGMFQYEKFTNKKCMVSLGTISYYKSKLSVKERDVYDYHFNYTKIVKIPFEKFTNKLTSNLINNRGVRKNILSQDQIKSKLIKYLNFPKHFQNYTYSFVRSMAYNIWEESGLDPIKSFSEFNKSIGLGE